MSFTHWHAKLAAWTHDPPEKALVLMRTREGHEAGTVRTLQEALFGSAGLPEALAAAVRRADHWASAADRPQWPRAAEDGRYPPWERVSFTERPVLCHPLSGESYPIEEKLAEIEPEEVEAISTRHFQQLLLPEGAAPGDASPRRTALAFWRFGPFLREEEAPELHSLWGMLPADGRVPDHSIWAHLDLASALATCFHADPEGGPALMAVSFGPVQDFIAQARTTSDLWAGSHLLSRIAWEGLKVLCDELGPDCVLFPQLRGIPQVDLWLRDHEDNGLPEAWFAQEEWRQSQTDSNPLFAAALPNKLVALVPASRAEALAARIEREVRAWVLHQAENALDALQRETRVEDASHARGQIRDQLEGFPEVHWAVVPWRALVEEESGHPPDPAALSEALGAFYPEGAPLGFLDEPVWRLLGRELRVEGTRFFTPNPGVLYPAVYELLERLHAAAKSVRPFAQLAQKGYRCSLCGEREWLTHDPALLRLPPGARREQATLWRGVRPAWARKGEHLCGPCTLKRLWPTLYAREVAPAMGGRPSRFVVSTHTMALSTSLEAWLDDPERKPLPLEAKMRSHAERLADEDVVALPRRLARRLHRAEREGDREARLMLRGVPLFLEWCKDEAGSDDQTAREQAESAREEGEQALKKVLDGRPEAYYALILMDGDGMGAWLSGGDPALRLRFEETWHPDLQRVLAERYPEGDLAAYRQSPRPVSPARHMAISAALNSFALHLARHVVEDLAKGKLLYAGGDDVLAMVSVDDLLPVLFLLRLAYAGVMPAEGAHLDQAWALLAGAGQRLDLRRGHVRYGGSIHRVMGPRATASAGAVVAHHQAPLGQVMRRLREAERRAKGVEGKDAFAVTLLKRSGGAVDLTCPWLPRELKDTLGTWDDLGSLEATPMGQLIRLRERFASERFSRRAAYLTAGWLEALPAAPDALATMLGHQLAQQTAGASQEKKISRTLGERLAQLAVTRSDPRSFVRDFLAVAEFLGREGRATGRHAMREA